MTIELFECDMNDPWNRFIYEVCDRDDLSPIQKPAALCFRYDAEMNNGGRCGYFAWCPDTVPEELIQALTTVAGPEFAENYRKALTKEEEENGYEETDKVFFDFEPSLTDHLMAYVDRHLDEIFL